MVENIYDPLTEYKNVFRDRFRAVADETFTDLVKEANIDIEKNKQICKQIYNNEKKLSSIKNHITWWTIWSVFLWLVVLGSGLFIFISITQNINIDTYIVIIIAFVVLLVIVYLFVRVHPKIKKLKKMRDELINEINKQKEDAWEQMTSLNNLYDWDILTRMMTKTIPRLEFDPYFTTQRLEDLKKTYNWDGSFNNERSVLYSLSGLINGNPFVICRTKKMEMGTKTYIGTKTITWTTREMDSDGKYRTVYHSETLEASVTAPYPEYFEHSRVIYGNTAAPDLIFYRKQSGIAGEENSLSYKWKKYKLHRKARNLSGADFAMLTNEDFEVAFNTSNRNNNQQFALLFTPLAQESMLNLLKDKEVGFGDDFDFDKNKMINTIIPNHIQGLNLDMNPNQYKHFDFEKAKEYFYNVNEYYFRSIYFSLAPLLCIPMYQQIRPLEQIYGHEMKKNSSFWEHEALANFWGNDKFRHPDCVTDCILKTEQMKDDQDNSIINVYAYGYRVKQRLSYISKWGGDGRYHDVPVYWDEYLPVTGNGNFYMKEINDIPDNSITQRQRINEINNVLIKTNSDLYRRHIVSKVN